MNQVYRTLPDDRPITSIHLVEDVERCPKGFVPVSRTHDQDSDADLWKESGFFGRKCTRYLCISKTEGIQNLVVQSLLIIGDKEAPPQGFKTISKTHDSGLSLLGFKLDNKQGFYWFSPCWNFGFPDQKAWRKKQLCYKFAHVSTCQTAVTDIIVLSRMKKAPEEFMLLGEINGMTICYKTGKTGISSLYPQSPYPVLPFNQNPTSPNLISQPNPSGRYSFGSPENGVNGADVLRPFRPAPKPPASTYATISGYNGLEGVPFVLNPKFNFSNDSNKDFSLPKIKTKSQIDEEYRYEFRTERQT